MGSLLFDRSRYPLLVERACNTAAHADMVEFWTDRRVQEARSNSSLRDRAQESADTERLSETPLTPWLHDNEEQDGGSR